MKFLLVLLALLALAFAQNHVDTAVIQVEDTADATSEHFFVSVDYIEDELDEAGQVLAERDIKVAIRFDVDEQMQVLVNGVPATTGYSVLQVSARIFEVETTGDHKPLPDIYSVSLRLFIGMVHEDDQTQVIIQERVVGIESSEVWQADVFQQVLIVRTNGEVIREETIQAAFLRGEPEEQPEPVDPALVDPITETVEGEKPEGKPEHGHHGGHHGGHGGHGGHHGGHHGQPDTTTSDEPLGEPQKPSPCWEKTKNAFRAALAWFHSLPLYLRILVSFASGVVLGLIGIGFLKCLTCACSGKKCKRSVAPAQTENYKANLRAYSLQYTSVPQEEKDAKKEGSIEMA